MKFSSIPLKFVLPWATDAAGAFIRQVPVASQIGIQAGAASYTDGFVPDNFTQIAAGGVPPFGQDMNGVIKPVTAWLRWYNAGGAIKYDAAFATDTNVGGYPQGAVVMSNVVPGNTFMSLVDNNTQDPDADGQTQWCVEPGTMGSGFLYPSLTATVPYGSVAANGLSIGSAASNATARANADCYPLFRFIWLNTSPSLCPINTPGGVPTTRGANPAADFAANKQLATPTLQGRGFVGIDTMGGAATSRLSGVPFSIGNATTVCSILGENLHQLQPSENGTHNHSITDPTHTHGVTDPTHQHTVAAPNGTANLQSGGFTASGPPLSSGSSFASTGISINAAATGISVNASGSGTAHNTVGQSVSGYWNLKL